MRSGIDFERFRDLGRVLAFAEKSACMQPVGQKVRVIGCDKSVDIDAAGYIQKGLKPATICKWLVFIRSVVLYG